MVSQCNVQKLFKTNEETWPPNQPKSFTPLVLIHHKGQHTLKRATAMIRLIHKGGIDSFTSNQSVPKHYLKKLDSHESLQEVLDSSTVTKELTEILAPLEQSKDPQFILIEGAPGIGKSFLLKEIAYRWGNKQLLKTFKLVLLVCLRDPSVQKAKLIKDLFQLFCYHQDIRATEISVACHDFFVQNGGKDIVFLFDGLDECLDTLQENGLIADILKRKVLPHCGLVVSSRPHATVNLREKATVRVDILGFTEIERNQFIEQALKEEPRKIKELTQYLENNFAISSLCVVPFNMVVLLFLYMQGTSLPKSSTELFNHFICLTIFRHLAKFGHKGIITDLTDLPNPCNEIILQLSKLSLESLDNKKMIFTLDEIKAACPNIETIPGAINGFGLLQAVQHFCLTGKTMTFSFLHLSIQEFLAAYHMTTIPPNKELKILNDKFWSDNYSNVFATYVTLTKGQRPSFKKFIKPSLVQRFKGFLKGKEVPISDQFLDTTLKCFHLFRCLFEVGGKDICTSIETAELFDSKTINFENVRLSPSDLECVMFFLTFSSHKEWKEINLCGCYLQDYGISILHRGLKSCDITIGALQLGFNNLTECSSTAISDITIKCKVKVLSISGNKSIGEDERLYTIISDSSSVLQTLNMWLINLSSSAIVKIFTAVAESKTLQKLWIYSNISDISKETCDVIVMAIKKNASLVKLYMHDIPIRGESAAIIVKALEHNSTLQTLCLPFGYDQEIMEKIASLAEEVNKKRESCKCGPVKLEIEYA